MKKLALVLVLAATIGCASNRPTVHGVTSYAPRDTRPDALAEAAADEQADRLAVEKMHAVKMTFNQNEFLGCQSVGRVNRDEIRRMPGDRLMSKLSLYMETYADDTMAPEFRFAAVQQGANGVFVLPVEHVSRTESVRTMSDKLKWGVLGSTQRIETKVETIEMAELYRCAP